MQRALLGHIWRNSSEGTGGSRGGRWLGSGGPIRAMGCPVSPGVGVSGTSHVVALRGASVLFLQKLNAPAWGSGTGHLSAKSGEVSGSPWGRGEGWGSVSSFRLAWSRAPAPCLPRGGPCVSLVCTHSPCSPRGAPGKFLPVTSAPELEQFPRNQPHPACSSQGPDGRLTLSLPPLGCLSGASPLPPGAAQCLNPQGARTQPGHFHTHSWQRRGTGRHL